jgi:hypothetical protein
MLRSMSLNRFVRLCLYRALPKITYETLVAWSRLGYWPNYRHPRTFNERLGHLKLYAPPPDAHILADKIAVRAYVESTVGAHLLTPLLHTSCDAHDIPWDTLPDAFVIKFSHNSGHTIVIDDKHSADRASVIARCSAALRATFGKVTNEPWYTRIKPQLVIEERMRDATHDIPLDYKFFVFGGQTTFIQVDHSRFHRHMRTFYTPSWEPQSFTLKYPIGPAIPKPARLDEMISIAEKLAGNHDFVRIDLYLIDDETIRFGEVTFAPEAGLGRFTPHEIDAELGDIWETRSRTKAVPALARS